MKVVKMGHLYSAYLHPDINPNVANPPTFDPTYGFPNGRKEREPPLTERQMQDALLLPRERDYCAHHLMDLYRCQTDNYPLTYRCKHMKHPYDQCQFDDYVLRMKEYERERRLLVRAKKVQEREEKANRQVLASA